MGQWIILKNIEDFKRKLAEEADSEKRRILEMLLAQETEKQRREASD
jgi:hypothetical protein